MSLNLEKAYTILENVTPPFLFKALRKSSLYTTLRSFARKVLKHKYTSSWNTIRSGELAGVELFFDPKGDWQKEMLSGNYDDFFSKYLSKVDMKGKEVYDIGAHIGYSALYFAKLVGPTGHVTTFEPNPYNIERIKMIFDRNKDLSSRITIKEVAVSNKNGVENFVFSPLIDNGTSSGSFIEGAHTIYPKEDYINLTGFKTTNVKTVALDTPPNDFKLGKDPDVVKLDIEGAEFLALEGMKEILKRAKPLLLIEVHSIYNMYIVGDILRSIGYSLELLKEEKDGRCFFAASISK